VPARITFVAVIRLPPAGSILATYSVARATAQKETANRIGCARSLALNRLSLGRERPGGKVADPAMSEDAAFLREQARRCRRLARDSSTPAVVATLKLMAADYDERADKLESCLPIADGEGDQAKPGGGVAGEE
jgi:hypothetical protein